MIIILYENGKMRYFFKNHIYGKSKHSWFVVYVYNSVFK